MTVRRLSDVSKATPIAIDETDERRKSGELAAIVRDFFATARPDLVGNAEDPETRARIDELVGEIMDWCEMMVEEEPKP